MLVVFSTRYEDVVHHSMVENKIRLAVQAVRTHVSVDGPVFCLIGFKRMTRPAHGGFAFEVHVRAHRFKPGVYLGYQIRHGKVLDVLDGVNSGPVQIKGFEPPQGISDELFRSVTIFPVHVGHVGRKLAVEPVLGPIATGLSANATCVEPFRVVLEVFVVFVHVIDHEVHHHSESVLVGCFNHGVKLMLRTQTRFHPSSLGWPVTVKGRHIVNTICSDSGACCCRVERG